jgi:hypothetical protein
VREFEAEISFGFGVGLRCGGVCQAVKIEKKKAPKALRHRGFLRIDECLSKYL